MQAVITKYLAPTETLGARIKVYSWLGNKVYSYDYSTECAHEAAFNEWLKFTNEDLKDKYKGNHDGFKLVSKASMPVEYCGYSFTVK